MPDRHELDELAICPSCGERNPSRAKFCMECGARLMLESGERRVVSVLFADLSGFTSFSETVDPETVGAVAQEAATKLGDIVDRYGGTVDKVIGDCVMAIFGAPTRHEDDPERAVRAALDMHAYVASHAEDFAGLGLSIGVFTGEAIYAPVGAQGSYTVLGDTVNTAARLQSAASRGETLVGEQTAKSIGEAIELAEVDPIVAKGKQQPVTAWRAVNVRGARKSLHTRTPFVGRRVELGRLSEVWELVRTQREPHLALVLGAPGMGKTRLVDAFLERARRNARVLVGHCLSYGEGITYWPVAEIIKDAAKITHNDDQDTVSTKLGALLEELGIDDLDQLRTIATSVANLVGAPRTPRGTYSAAEISRGELHWGLRRLLELLSMRTPLVVVVEDLHWAEPALLDLLTYLLDGGGRTPLLVLGTARSELREGAHRILDPRKDRRLIQLDPLDGAACAELVAAVTDAPLTPALLAASAGNPLFLEELARAGGDHLPETVHALIDVRLDRLGAEERKVAGEAAVVGQRFWQSALRALGARDPGPTIQALIDADIMQPVAVSALGGEQEYEFRHSLLRDVAYARVPKSVRAGLHRTCGEWVDGLSQDNDLIEIVAYHFEQACVLAREVDIGSVEAPVLAAVDALKRAGGKAEGRQGTREADRYYARALEILGDEMPEAAMGIKVQRARCRTLLGDLQNASEQLREVDEKARVFGRADLRCNALLQQITLGLHTGQVAEARAAMEQTRTLTDQLGDRRLRVRALFASSELNTFDGRLEDAADELREALSIAEQADDGGLRVGGHMRLATALFNMGHLDLAAPEFAKSAEFAAAEGTLMPQAMATAYLGLVRFYTGPREEAEELCRRALGWFERTPNRSTQLQTLKVLARLALARGEYEEAEAHLEEARGHGRNASSLLVEIDRLRVSALLGQGRIEEARAAAREAFENAQEDDAFVCAEAALATAAVATAMGDEHEAKGSYGRALALLEPLGLPIDLAEARAAAAAGLVHLGASAEARVLVAEAKDAFAAAGAAPMLDDLRALEMRLADEVDTTPAGQT